MKRQRFNSGEYYGITRDGEARRIHPPDGTRPNTIIARRVTDFPEQRVPAGGTVVPCTRCQTPVVTNLLKFPDVPRRCMQCAGIIPEPLP